MLAADQVVCAESEAGMLVEAARSVVVADEVLVRMRDDMVARSDLLSSSASSLFDTRRDDVEAALRELLAAALPYAPRAPYLGSDVPRLDRAAVGA